MSDVTEPQVEETKDDDNLFNADKRSRERTAKGLMIGGKLWHPAKRTGKVAKEIAKLGTPPDNDGSSDALEASMDYLYANIALLLEDEKKERPDVEWLMGELEWDVAQDMMSFLNPELAAQMDVTPGNGTAGDLPAPTPITRTSSNATSSSTGITT